MPLARTYCATCASPVAKPATCAGPTGPKILSLCPASNTTFTCMHYTEFSARTRARAYCSTAAAAGGGMTMCGGRWPSRVQPFRGCVQSAAAADKISTRTRARAFCHGSLRPAIYPHFGMCVVFFGRRQPNSLVVGLLCIVCLVIVGASSPTSPELNNGCTMTATTHHKKTRLRARC